MSTRTQDTLIDALAEVGTLYPNMRFGQLIEMVALLSAEETPMGVADVDDDQLLNTASNHARRRRERLKPEQEPIPEGGLSGFRTELLDVLQRVRMRVRNPRFGCLVLQLALSSGSSLYDAEDEQLLAAARG